MKKKVISFSLWGDDEEYNIGALENVAEAAEFYPDWICRFYVDRASPVLGELRKLPCEVVEKPIERSFRPGFWRFLAASDPEVQYVVCRDCDARVNAREAGAVAEWIASGKNVHLMHETDGHTKTYMLAGMWGIRGGVIRDMGALMADWFTKKRQDNKGGDQAFLKEIIWPRVKGSVLCHGKDFVGGKAEPFPKHERLKPGQWFVGQSMPVTPR